MIEPPVAWVPGSGYSYDVKVLEPFNAYWIRNLTAGPIPLHIAPVAADIMPAGPKGVADDGWRLRVVASVPGAVDGYAELGGASGARAARDRLDRTLPPPLPQHNLAVCFPHGEWEEHPGRYARDLRPVQPGDGSAWCFDVAKSYSTESGGDVVTLLVRGTDGLAGNARAVLVDRRLGKRVDLDGDTGYDFFLGVHEPARDAEGARFAVIVGDEAFVAAQAMAMVDRPARSVLHQNHPNPFNPATVIRYDLADAARVDLRIYDVRGTLVRVLEARDRGPGRYEIGWDGTDDRGTRVASGVYFYRLQAGRFSATRKMVLLK
jgi:hypothetical protein